MRNSCHHSFFIKLSFFKKPLWGLILLNFLIHFTNLYGIPHCLAPKSEIIRVSPNNPSWLNSLIILKLLPEEDAFTIGSTTVRRWLIEHKNLHRAIFLAFSTPVPDIFPHYIGKEHRIEYVKIIRKWNLQQTKSFLRDQWILPYVDSDIRPYYLRDLDQIKRTHLDMVRHTYFAKRRGHRPLAHLTPEPDSNDEYLVKRLRFFIFQAVRAPYLATFRRFKTTDEVLELPFWELPIFPVDDKNHIQTQLLHDWALSKTKSPSPEWLYLLERGKVKSLKEISGLSMPPVIRRPQPSQLYLFEPDNNLQKSA